jgi:hypothetical protein
LFVSCFIADPTGTLSGGHTDHVAHTGETRAVTVVGARLWREPAATLFRSVTDDELRTLPSDLQAYAVDQRENIHHVPSFAPHRPLVMNFPHLPRCYPPGVFLVSAPSAALLHVGWLSFTNSNRLYIALLLLAWWCCVWAWTETQRRHALGPGRLVWLIAVSLYVWYWAIEGFYDVAALAFASLGQVAAQRADGSKTHVSNARFAWAGAALGWAVAGFIHPRMLALVPVAVLPFWRVVTLGGAANADPTKMGAKTAPRPRRDWLTALGFLVATLLLGASLGFAWWIQPTVKLHAAAQPMLRNVVRPGGGTPVVAAGYAVAVLAMTWILARRRFYFDAMVALLVATAFATQRYLTPWYWLLILPWAMVPPLRQQGLRASVTVEASALESSRHSGLQGWPLAARVVLTSMFYVASQAAKW